MIARQPTLRGRDEGAVALEAALILTLLMLLLLGIIEFTVAWWQLNTMSLAVAHAGRYVMINNTTCNTAVCAENRMQLILTNAAVCTTPAVDQTCVTASLSTKNTTAGMSLTASYGFNFAGIRLTMIPISSGIWVPLD